MQTVFLFQYSMK